MILDRIDSIVKKNSLIILVIFSCILIINNLLHFDIRISLGGDDSYYIIAAKDFLDGKSFPSWHGAMYPLFLSLFVAIFKDNIFILKLASELAMLGAFILFFKAFFNRVHGIALLASIAIFSVSKTIAYYAGQTYSEAFFMLLQSLLFFWFLKEEDTLLNKSIKQAYKKWLLFGFLLFITANTRTVALASIGAFVVYFLWQKKYLKSVYILGAFTIYHLPFTLIKKTIWGSRASNFSAQFKALFYKDFYKKSEGLEDFNGIIHRFIDNSNLYLSKHAAKIMGIVDIDIKETSSFITILFYVLFGIGIFFAIKKKNNLMLFIGIYLMTMIGATFIMLQAHWDQERLIMIYVPLIVLLFVYALYQLFINVKTLKKLSFAIPLVLIILTIRSFSMSMEKVDMLTLIKNVKGDRYYGYTEDWHSYLKLANWASKNIHKDSAILCRKPNMARIYGEANFKGIYRIPTKNPDSVRMYLQDRKISYCIMGSLRINPHVRTNRTINTVKNTLTYMLSKYPTSLKLVKHMGKIEPAYLFKLDYSKPKGQEDLLLRLESAALVWPGNPNIMNEIARIYIEKKKFDKADFYLNTSLKIDDENFLSHQLKGVVYYNKQNINAALNEFQKASQIDPKNGQNWYNIGVCYRMLGKSGESGTAFARAASLGYQLQ